MKILHVGKYYAPIEGGVESINRVVVDALKGNRQRVVSFNKGKTSEEDDVDGIPVVRAATYGVVASQPLSLKYFSELRRAIRMFQPDIIHFHYPNPLGALYLQLLIPRNIKLIVHWHSDIVAQETLYKLIKPIEKRLLKRADSIIVTSPIYRDASRLVQPYKEKVNVIPCSINQHNFDLREGEEQAVADIKQAYDNKPIVFFVGRHVSYKGLEYLLDAENYVTHDCFFVIAGQGELTGRLKEKYSSERIRWVGRLSDTEMRLYYHAAAVFAFPSITRNEAFGVVLAESMYCGCPDVTFTIPGSGVNWVSPDRVSAIEIKNRDAMGYAQAIDMLLADEELRERLGRAGHRRAMELFSKEVVEQQYRDLYHQLSNQ